MFIKMPELPEVETVKRGLSESILNKEIKSIHLNIEKLRYVLDKNLFLKLKGLVIKNIYRRGKHLILTIENNLQIIIHLGMSGTLKVIDKDLYINKKHDHIIINFDDILLVYNDPRRFGYWLININENPLNHKCLKNHGLEPLTANFNADYLFSKLQKTSRKIKQTIMDNSIVVGVGNIYACESLFLSKISPFKKSNTLTKLQCKNLVNNIKNILIKAIEQGGTTLKDYKNTQDKPGYFTQSLNIYGRKNDNCYICNNIIESELIAQRNTFFCPNCQNN